MIEVLYANMHPHGQCRIFYQCYLLFFVQYFKRKKVSLCWLHVPGLTWAMNANLSKAEPSTLTIESIAT
jgi:hypothetical protein